METITNAAPAAAYDHDLTRVLCPQAHHEVARLRYLMAEQDGVIADWQRVASKRKAALRDANTRCERAEQEASLLRAGLLRLTLAIEQHGWQRLTGAPYADAKALLLDRGTSSD